MCINYKGRDLVLVQEGSRKRVFILSNVHRDSIYNCHTGEFELFNDSLGIDFMKDLICMIFMLCPECGEDMECTGSNEFNCNRCVNNFSYNGMVGRFEQSCDSNNSAIENFLLKQLG